jgi:hypothetical protein
VAVFDDIFSQREGFGFSWSVNGTDWATPATVIEVPGGARTPLGSMLEADGTLTVYYTAYVGGVERVQKGSFELVIR